MFDVAIFREALMAFSTLGRFSVSENQARMLTKLGDLLYEKNEFLNLTRIPPEHFLEKHIIDSIAFASSISLEGPLRVVDIGTGGGFPALPLAILFPNLSITALDSTRKKLVFVEEVAKALGLCNVKILHGRAEEVAKMSIHKMRYDLVVARAVASLSKLAPWILPFVKDGGCAVALKGPLVDSELAEYRKIYGDREPSPEVIQLPIFFTETPQLAPMVEGGRAGEGTVPNRRNIVVWRR